MVARGKAIFEAGVGGIPCAACHGEDQTSIVGPVVEGRDAAAVHDALAKVAAMGSLMLSDDQIAAVSAYLGSIGVGVRPGGYSGARPASSSPSLIELATRGKEIF
jgi:mono/diheme cytochrome c family protein